MLLSSITVNDLLDVTNLGQNPISVIVKKSAPTNVLQYAVTVEEWYGAANVPGYLDKDSLISDFFVDIFVLQGNFGGDFDGDVLLMKGLQQIQHSNNTLIQHKD